MKQKALISFISLCLAAPSLNAQALFSDATHNTVLPTLELKSLVNASDEGDAGGWTLGGEESMSFRRDSACFINPGSWIVSPEVNASDYTALELHVTMATLTNQSSLSSSNNYQVIITYPNGQEQTFMTAMDVASYDFATYVTSLAEITGDTFNITIKMAETSSSYRSLIKDITLYGIRKVGDPQVEVGNTSISLQFDSYYDSCVIDLLKAESNATGVDTLYFSDFTGAALNGAEASTEPTQSYDYFNVSGTDLYLSVPLAILGVSDTVHVELSTMKFLQTDTATYHITFNDEQIGTISRPRADESGVWTKHQFSFVPSSSYGTLKVSVTNTVRAYLLIDDMLVYQNATHSYRSLDGFPQTISGSMVATGLLCNEEYRIMMQCLKDANEYGEQVVSPLQDFTVMTTGDNIVMEEGETLDLIADFEGSIVMGNTNAITGNHRVMGELCYAFTYQEDSWEAIGLPFAPRLIEAYIGGKAYTLRENVSYQLQAYTDKGDGTFSFARQGSFEGFAGYILKVSSDITQYDDKTIYIYSEKGEELNAPREFTYTTLYAHVANPYTYPLDDAWEVFSTECLYKYNGSSAFRLYTVDDVIEPFESVIVYTGSALSAPKAIYIDGSETQEEEQEEEEEDEEGNSSVSSLGNSVFITVYGGAFAINNHSGRVTVHSTSGAMVFDGHLADGEQVSLPRGIYIVNYVGTNKKIIIQ